MNGIYGTSTLSHSRRWAGTEFRQSAWQPIGCLFVVLEELVDSGKWWTIINAIHHHTTGMLSLRERES